jgi:PhnB protein
MPVKKKQPKKKVAPIPKSYKILTPYLAIRGGVQALDWYKKAFGAKERMRMPGPDGKIGHAELEIGDCVLMLADEFPGMNTSPATLNGTTVTLLLYVKDVDAAFKKAVDLGAASKVPPETKFYGDRSGILADPFGHLWCLSTHVEDVPPKEMAKRAAEMAAKMAEKPPQT